MAENSDLSTPVCLVIMDGFGLDAPSASNAISLADTPVLDKVLETCPHTSLNASGRAVGLPEGQMGNSEVGHLNIGAGRVVAQELTRINEAVASGALGQNQVLIEACKQSKKTGAVLHFMGLVSDGGVHSSKEHLYALLKLAVDLEVPEIYIHCFLDGRDVPPRSGIGYIKELMSLCSDLSAGQSTIRIASLSGRYYAMDRDKRWDRVEMAYHTIVDAHPFSELNPLEYIERSYADDVTDEFLLPASFVDRGVEDGDSIVFFNFRPDRAREITRSIVDQSFEDFERKRKPNVLFTCLTEYDPTISAEVAFKKEFPKNVLADVISHAGLRQYHIAETEKYAHVTFFLNGGVEEPKAGEIRVLIPSPHIPTYDLQPEMSAAEVSASLAKAITDNVADVYIVNFANCDMVGHTGSIPAAVKAVEAVDRGVGEVLAAMEGKRGVTLLTADHGNADKMLDEDGSPFTAHTTAMVPLILVDASSKKRDLLTQKGSLSNIAPTLLDIIGLDKPEEMVASSFLANNEQVKV